jgi:1,2-beta-oligoglucan phosphorylase
MFASSTSRGRPAWSSAGGLRIETEADGALRLLALGDVVLNLFVANALEGGPANLALRSPDATPGSTLLLGPRSPTRWLPFDAAAARLEGHGEWSGLRYGVVLQLAADAPAWFWHLHVQNIGSQSLRIEALHWQDLALASYGAVRLNEYYVSQYVDHTPLEHAQRGVVVASRQNQPVGTRHPWCLLGSLQRAVTFATDALQVYGKAARAGLPPPCIAEGLAGKRLQHEHAMVALQDELQILAPGAALDLGWFGCVLEDHPAASSPDDLALVDATLALPEAKPPVRSPTAAAAAAAVPPATSLFVTAPLLCCGPLDESWLDRRFGRKRRHVERDAEGRLLSFFHGQDAHVVLREKEVAVLRPHGQILRSGSRRVPDESALTSTVWMGGVFHSMVTQGHVSINRCLSTVRSYLSLFRAQGLRVFVRLHDGWQLLDQPSAFEMRPDACCWIYRHAGGCIEVTSDVQDEPHALGLAFHFVEGPALPCLVSLHVALNGDDGSTPGPAHWRREGEGLLIVPAPGSELAQRFPDGALRVAASAGTIIEEVMGDAPLFADGLSRALPWVTLRILATRRWRLKLEGLFVTEGVDVPTGEAGREPPRLGAVSAVAAPAASLLAPRLQGLADLLPWLEQNALVHYLSPRGLEQFSGGGWGTRDVSQGPVEMLLAQGRHEAVRDLLQHLMKAQRRDGDWPQWFMFFQRDAAIRAGDSHGDIVFWPLLALGQYLLASGDAAILDEPVPFHGARRRGAGPRLWTHVQRALALIRARTIAGTALPAYGHGDWNDSLQPADPALRDQLCSAWTATLHVQTLTTLARGLRAVGRGRSAARLEREAGAVRHDFRRLLLADGVLAGYARFEGQAVELLLHPRDEKTGVRYSLLAMIHAILEGLLTPQETQAHLQLIDDHLSGPDGARLFDRPLAYHGGPQRLFQRAESASYFGREIGLMYMHAHLRYAQALAHVGAAERFFHALTQANPIALQEIVPSAAPRSANTYASSSDAAFADRYDASAQYGRIGAQTVALEAGWRVYSSGAGILYGLVMRQLFGLRIEGEMLVLDPVLPPALDGVSLRLELFGRELQIVYQVRAPGFGVAAVHADERALALQAGPANPYRNGGVRIVLAEITSENTPTRLIVQVGDA